MDLEAGASEAVGRSGRDSALDTGDRVVEAGGRGGRGKEGGLVDNQE